MKTVFVLFNSLNRHMLGPYGGRRVPTPNFDRLAGRSAVFEQHYVGSLPCMPARRDMQTGRLNFLHRSWGPLEPFDNSFPELLRATGIYSHLITDHCHYWHDGGATYHSRFDTYEFVRGQEKDPWKAMVQPPWERLREMYHERQLATEPRSNFRNNLVNREFIKEEKDFPSVRCFDAALEFLERNGDADGWLLQLETFDPHEPFTAPERFKRPFETGWNGPVRDWPRYGRVDELPAECDELRANYYALMSLCDELLGQLLDDFDRLGLWKDTALVVSTDHGFLLGEHDFWAKNRMTLYEEIAHIPLFVHHPQMAVADGARRRALTQTIDLAPTFLDIFGAARPAEMQGHSLLPALADDQVLRQGALFGYFGGAVNVTDGRHTYHRYPPDLRSQEIYQYTLMPMHLKSLFLPAELAPAELSRPLAFTKGAPVLKVPVAPEGPWFQGYPPGTLLESTTRLFDLATDPGQEHPLDDPTLETAMMRLMAELMVGNDAPPEALARVGLARAPA